MGEGRDHLVPVLFGFMPTAPQHELVFARTHATVMHRDSSSYDISFKFQRSERVKLRRFVALLRE